MLPARRSIATEIRQSRHESADGGEGGMEKCHRAVKILTVSLIERRYGMAAVLWTECSRGVKV